MGLLGNILEASPGVIAKGFEGVNKVREKELEEKRRQERAIREKMLEIAARETQDRRNQETNRREREAREARDRKRQEEAFGHLRSANPERFSEMIDGVNYTQLLQGQLGRRPEDPGGMLNIHDREFPDTPEGRRAGLEWRREYMRAGHGPNENRLHDLERRQGEERLRRAEGNATAFVRAMLDPESFAGNERPDLDRNTIIQLLRAQHEGLSIDEANAAFENALEKVQHSMRRQRDLDQDGGGDGNITLPPALKGRVDDLVGKNVDPGRILEMLREANAPPTDLLRVKRYLEATAQPEEKKPGLLRRIFGGDENEDVVSTTQGLRREEEQARKNAGIAPRSGGFG